jgi:hypothetical protein
VTNIKKTIQKTTDYRKAQRILEFITGIILGILFISYAILFVYGMSTTELVSIIKYQRIIYVISGIVTISYMILTISFRSISRRQIAKLKTK